MGKKAAVGQVWILSGGFRHTITKIHKHKDQIWVDVESVSGPSPIICWATINDDYTIPKTWIWKLEFDPSGENCLQDCCKDE
jgi:hypothetical protein